ncbi:MAG: serine hydrolase domain-containing protein, partial [Acutalibacteraceae bacterium]
RKETEYSDIFRMMSMTKPVVSVGIMKLIEQGRLGLDDAVSAYLPEFKDMAVIADKRFEWKEKMNPLSNLFKLAFFNQITPKTVPAERDFTVRDLLSHTSGLEQGVWGFMAFIRNKERRTDLAEVCRKYGNYYLDWQPGTMTSYSALAGFDVLTRLIEVITQTEASKFFKEEIFEPLNMNNSSFFTESQSLVRLYKHTKKGLKDVTDTKADVKGFIKMSDGYVCGSGGLYSTVDDYENFARMLCNDGVLNGKQFLKEETVRQIHTEAPPIHLEPEPGQVWGLGVRIRQDGKKGNFNSTEGTYGWSGAFGTHFFISPKDKLTAVWLTNISNAGGSGYPVSKEIERLVFDTFVR